MAKYVIVATVNSNDKLPRVLDLWAFKSDNDAYRFAEELASANRFEYAGRDINYDPIYATAFENDMNGSVEYRTICVKKSRTK